VCDSCQQAISLIENWLAGLGEMSLIGNISTVRRWPGRKISPMFIDPEAQTPILRTQ